MIMWLEELGRSGKPKRNADDKQLAAEAALRLCRAHGIAATTTKAAKGGKLCRLAAVLHGDPRADLQHQCREALRKSAKPGKKYVLVPR
jgi:hypothetical protein